MKGVTGSLVASCWVWIRSSYNAPCSQRYWPEVHFSDESRLQNRPNVCQQTSPGYIFQAL